MAPTAVPTAAPCETSIDEWYVARHDREERFRAVVVAANEEDVKAKAP
jgi:hypothetical protein